MGAGCSSSSRATAKSTTDAPAPAPTGPRAGHVYLSYHPSDTGDQRSEGGDGAAGRVRDWLVSRGYVVTLGVPDPDYNPGGEDGPGPRRAAGVQSGVQLSWQAQMQQSVEQCQAFVALCSEHYGSRPEAAREVNAADSLAASATTLLPLWHSGPWPPEGPMQPLLGHLKRVPRGTRPLCRTILEGVMGELVDRLQQAGCMPAPKAPAAAADGAAPGGAAPAVAAAAAATVSLAESLEPYFQPREQDPKEDAYVVVRCYTGQLQELSDRLALTLRPTIFDLGGNTFSGDLPVLPSSSAGGGWQVQAPPAVDAGPPAAGGTLLIGRPHVTLRNGSLKLRQDQEIRISGAGVVLDTISVLTEPKQGPHGVGLGAAAGGYDGYGGYGGGGAGGGGAGGGGAGGAGLVVGAPYESGRGMVVLAGAGGVRMLRCQLTNHARYLALWLVGGATAALRDTQVESPNGGGVWVRDAGSSLVAQSCRLQRCSGPCLMLEAGGAAQLASCSVLDSSAHNGVLVGSGSRLRADKCVVSGSQVGINLHAGASAEMAGCEVVSNTLAGVEVSEPGSSLAAVDTKFSMNGQSGVLVASGGSASLTSCSASGNKAHGVLVRGDGSVGSLRQVTLSYNGQAGALLSDRARADLTTCEATGNKVCGLIVWGKGTTASGADCKVMQNVQAGLAVKDGGSVELKRCMVKSNKLPCEVSGAGSRLVTEACLFDVKPTVVNGGAYEVVDSKGKKK